MSMLFGANGSVNVGGNKRGRKPAPKPDKQALGLTVLNAVNTMRKIEKELLPQIEAFDAKQAAERAAFVAALTTSHAEEMTSAQKALNDNVPLLKRHYPETGMRLPNDDGVICMVEFRASDGVMGFKLVPMQSESFFELPSPTSPAPEVKVEEEKNPWAPAPA